MSKKELPPDFFKQFKDGESFKDYMQELYKQGIESLLEAEMEAHLGYEKHSPTGRHSGNSRNGKSQKKLKSKLGEVEISVPRDRDSSFAPQVVPKRKRVAGEIEDVVISLYAKGMSVRDIEEQIKEIYGVELSDTKISNITSRVLEDAKLWQNRPLPAQWLIVWMDGIYFKVRQDGKVINKCIFLAIGLSTVGKKEVLGMWLNQTESAAFWMQVLTDLQARGVSDIVIAAIDNLKGFKEAIESIFPETDVQLCVAHQIRNSLRYVVWKDKKAVASALKKVYGAPNLEAATMALEEFEKRWTEKYPVIGRQWKNNWEGLTPFFQYPLAIRKIMYTTNIIENLNRNVRRFTKNKTMFPHDGAVQKAVYLAIMQISKKWTRPVHNWPLILSQFVNKFEDRIQIDT